MNNIIVILIIVIVSAVRARPVDDDVAFEEKTHDQNNKLAIDQESAQQKQAPPQFYDVDGDAFGDDFVDFGAQTGLHGAYMWYTSYPLHKVENDDSDEE